jgi:hypothetical protein
MATLRVKEPFAVDVKGAPRVLTAGQLVDSTDPVVKGREHLFEAIEAYMVRSSPEQATAAPGEKRSVAKRAPQKNDD